MQNKAGIHLKHSLKKRRDSIETVPPFYLIPNKLKSSIHVNDSFVKLLLAAYLFGFAISLGISYEVFKFQLAIFKFFTLSGIE